MRKENEFANRGYYYLHVYLKNFYSSLQINIGKQGEQVYFMSCAMSRLKVSKNEKKELANGAVKPMPLFFARKDTISRIQ